MSAGRPSYDELGEAEERRAAGSIAARISTGIVQLLSRYTGRGPTRARTTVNTNVIVVVLEDALTTAERTLVASGASEAVQSIRRTFAALMRDDSVALVERISGRTVIGYISDVDVESNVAAKVFVLQRHPETGVVVTGESDELG